MKIGQDRYEIIGTLGTGASSRVDKARDSTIGRTVAVKTFLHGFGSEDLQKQFLREAQIVGRLTHPSIVSLYDVGTNTEGVPYLILEYVEGKTLEHTLAAGPLPLERAAVWAADLASALARAHQCKIIHGDIKPLREYAVAEVRPLLRTLFFAVAIVLLLTCLNVAGLLLVRAIRRRREYAVRLALGARSSVIVSESVVEGLLPGDLSVFHGLPAHVIDVAHHGLHD